MAGYWNMDFFNETLARFSKYTYDVTGGYLMVVDLQVCRAYGFSNCWHLAVLKWGLVVVISKAEQSNSFLLFLFFGIYRASLIRGVGRTLWPTLWSCARISGGLGKTTWEICLWSAVWSPSKPILNCNEHTKPSPSKAASRLSLFILPVPFVLSFGSSWLSTFLCFSLNSCHRCIVCLC